MESYSCPDPTCSFVIHARTSDALASLNAHWRRKHGRTAEELYVTLFCAGVKPTCKCGCGGAVAFFGIHKGFGVWLRGHVSRVKNNWGHNVVVREKSLETRRNMFESGELTTWNSGLTKETDVRVAAYGVIGSATIMANDVQRQARSERMTANRLSKVVPDLTGSAHPQWKGGTSQLQSLCRSHLFRSWTYPKLVAAGFRCQTPGCESKGELNVHHDGERFAEILHKGVDAQGGSDELDDTFSFARKAALAEWVTAYHLDHGVSGIVLCEACHTREHTANAPDADS